MQWEQYLDSTVILRGLFNVWIPFQIKKLLLGQRKMLSFLPWHLFCTYTNLWNLILICTLNEALSPQKWNGPRLVETLVILTEMEEGQCKFSSWLIHCTNVSLWPTLSLPSQRPWPYLFLLCSLCLWYWLTLGTFPTGILLFVLNKISYKSRMTHNWPYSRGWPWTPEPLATDSRVLGL